MSDSDLHSPEPPSALVIDGRYRLLRLIGIGGMGAVYEAEHVAIGRRVAIKILHSQFSQHADLVERLRREAQAASRIGHPNIVDVTDFGRTPDGSAYLAMEFLHGTDLGAILRERGSLAEARAVLIGLQTAQALAAAHRVGVVHRDLKPENIFIVNPTDFPALAAPPISIAAAPGKSPPRSGGPPSSPGAQDLVKVLDFGIAVQLGSVPPAETELAMPQVLRAGRLTNPGLTVGTPEYMAPEQAMGSGVDARADIYAVGTLLYEMVCARVPFVAPSVPELLTMKTDQPAPAPRLFAPSITPALEELILRCLERDPKNRPQSMEGVEEALLEIVAASESRLSTPSAGSANSGASGEQNPASSWDLIGRVAVPTPSSVTPPAATSLESSASGSPPAATPPRFSTRASAALIFFGAVCIVLVGFISARFIVRREPRLEPPVLSRNSLAPVVAAPAPVPLAPPVRQPEPPRASAPPAAIVPAPMPPMLVPPAPTPTSLQKAPEESRMLLEWARRAAAGHRYTAPPGDNLQELLARLEATEGSSAEAHALRDETTRALSRRLREELRRRHTLDALESFRALHALDPGRHVEGPRKELLYQLLFLARTGRHGPGPKGASTLLAAHGAIEVAPTSASAYLALADAQLAIGKREAAASTYRRVLELHPRLTERRLAEQGLSRLGKVRAK